MNVGASCGKIANTVVASPGIALHNSGAYSSRVKYAVACSRAALTSRSTAGTLRSPRGTQPCCISGTAKTAHPRTYAHTVTRASWSTVMDGRQSIRTHDAVTVGTERLGLQDLVRGATGLDIVRVISRGHQQSGARYVRCEPVRVLCHPQRHAKVLGGRAGMHAPTTSTTLALPYSGDAFKLGWKPTMALNSPDAEVLNTGLCGTQWQCACGDDVEAAPTPAATSSSHPHVHNSPAEAHGADRRHAPRLQQIGGLAKESIALLQRVALHPRVALDEAGRQTTASAQPQPRQWQQPRTGNQEDTAITTNMDST